MITISSTKNIKQNYAPRKRQEKTSVFQLGQPAQSIQASAIQHAPNISPSYVETETVKQNFKRKSTEILDNLENLQKSLLSECVPEQLLKDLRKTTQNLPDANGDRKMQTLKELIEIRVAVEIAKRDKNDKIE